MKSVDRDNEVNRIISAFRLNPFEQLGVRFDATPEEIRRQYRKVSMSTPCPLHCQNVWLARSSTFCILRMPPMVRRCR